MCGQLYLSSHRSSLINLTTTSAQVDEDATQTIERFLILLNDTSTDFNKARCQLFVMKNKVQLIPPTSAALKQHVRRAVYQGGHVWGQALLPAPALPSPSTDVGSRRASRRTSLTGQHSLRHPRSAGTSSPANARRAARRSASARRQSWNAHNYVHVKASAVRTELGTPKQSYTYCVQ